jgi:hypothetical protein
MSRRLRRLCGAESGDDWTPGHDRMSNELVDKYRVYGCPMPETTFEIVEALGSLLARPWTGAGIRSRHHGRGARSDAAPEAFPAAGSRSAASRVSSGSRRRSPSIRQERALSRFTASTMSGYRGARSCLFLVNRRMPIGRPK